MEYAFQVGVSLGIGETLDADENLQSLVSSGMHHVEIGYAPHADNPDWTTNVRQVIETSAVRINSVHAPFSRTVDISRLDDGGAESAIAQIERAISSAQRLGAGLVVVHGSAEPIEPTERPQRFARSQESLRIIGAKAEAAGVRVALELLPRTCLGRSADELQALLADVPDTQVGFCLDANHLADTCDLISTVKQLGKRIITLHISDYDGVDEKHWMPFEGVVDWAAFVNALAEIGYAGAFIYETMPAVGTVAEKLAEIAGNYQRIVNAGKAAKNAEIEANV